VHQNARPVSPGFRHRPFQNRLGELVGGLLRRRLGLGLTALRLLSGRTLLDGVPDVLKVEGNERSEKTSQHAGSDIRERTGSPLHDDSRADRTRPATPG